MDEGANEKPKRKRKPKPPTGKPPGRPLFFGDADRLAKFFEAVEVFGNFSDACKMVGVDRGVIYNERDRNPEFAAKLEAAKLAIEFEAVDTLRKGKKDKNWRRAAWLAEKKNARRWGRKDPQAVTPEMILAVTNRLQAVILAFVAEERRADASAAFVAILSEFSNSFAEPDPDEETEEGRDDG